MTLDEAIAKVKGVSGNAQEWDGWDFCHESEGYGPTNFDNATATILNAVTSGDLIPKADADLAVAEALRKAGETLRKMWSDPDSTGEMIEAAILALAPPMRRLRRWNHLRPETRQFWTDTAARILSALTETP